MHKRKRQSKGFTLIEVIVTLVILAILAGLSYGTVTGLAARAEQNAQDQVARSLFMAAQSALTHVYANDPTMVESLENAAEAVSIGLISPAPESAEWTKELALNGGNILSLTSNAGGGEALLALLDGYVDDKAVLNHSIVIEYNRQTGNVLACFYAKEAALSHGEGGYDVYRRDEASLRSGSVGVYMVEYTGSRAMRSSDEHAEGLDELSVRFVDYDDPGAARGNNINGGNNYGLLTLECALPAGAPADTVYEIAIHAYAGQKKAESFTLRIGPSTAVAHVAMDGIGSNLNTVLHKPIGYTESGLKRGAALFIDPRPDAAGRALLVLVLDSQVEGAGICELYPEIADGELTATVTAHSASTGVDYQAASNSAHALYAGVDKDGLASVASVRHLNNLRYTPGGGFAQTRDIIVYDYTGQPWPMAPLGDALAPDGAFSGSYDGRGHAIQGLTMPEGTKNAGLFTCIAADARVEHVRLCDSEITGSLRAGGIAAENSGTISACAVYNGSAAEDFPGLRISATGAGAQAGGVAASNSGKISACAVNDADAALGMLSIAASGMGAAAGAIAAESSGTVEDCFTGAGVEVQSLPGSQSTGLSNRGRGYIGFTGIAA